MSDEGYRDGFMTTQWSLFCHAGAVSEDERAAAIQYLCSHYWRPLYLWLRHHGHDRESAEDAVQGLFESIIQKPDFLNRADPSRGRFRSFVLGALKNHLKDRNKYGSAMKRGGHARIVSMDLDDAEKWLPAVDDDAPFPSFDTHWAWSIMAASLEELSADSSDAMHQALDAWLRGSSPFTTLSQMAATLNATEESVRTRLSRMRRKLRTLVDRRIRETVKSPEDFHEEREYIKQILLRTGH